LPNVVITGHQFLTREALTHIAETTLVNISDFQLRQQKSGNLVTATANRTTKAGCASLVLCAVAIANFESDRRFVYYPRLSS
jgi:hypothetical protein